MLNEKYLIKVGKKKLYLNHDFLVQNNALDNIEEIRELFKNKLRLYSRMERASKPKTLQRIAKEVTENEFKIQEVFNFERDARYHRFWEMPKCKCPVMDNQDNWGTGLVWYNELCPIHGQAVKDFENDNRDNRLDS